MKSAKKIGGVGPAGSTGSNGTSVSTSLAVSSALKSSPRSTPSRDSPFDSGKKKFKILGEVSYFCEQNSFSISVGILEGFGRSASLTIFRNIR